MLVFGFGYQLGTNVPQEEGHSIVVTCSYVYGRTFQSCEQWK